MQHNEAMTDRYFSGVSSQEHLPAYDTTNPTRASTAASTGKMEEEVELKEAKGNAWPNSHAVTTRGQQTVFPTVQERDEDAVQQRVHEIV